MYKITEARCTFKLNLNALQQEHFYCADMPMMIIFYISYAKHKKILMSSQSIKCLLCLSKAPKLINHLSITYIHHFTCFFFLFYNYGKRGITAQLKHI